MGKVIKQYWIYEEDYCLVWYHPNLSRLRLVDLGRNIVQKSGFGGSKWS